MKFFKRVIKEGLKSAYYIGFLPEEKLMLPKNERYKQVSWLQIGNYKGGWFADPFFLSIDGNDIKLLVEEYIYSQEKGILSILEIEKEGNTFTLKKVTPILELPTHLSFPYVIREDEHIYVMPENWHGGALFLYELDCKLNKLVNRTKIIDAPLVDSQMFISNGNYYIIGTKKQETKDYTRYADIYRADSITGPYRIIQNISNANCVERGAGEIYQDGDRFIRPVQKCDNAYGEAVILNELKYVNGLFTETAIDIVSPNAKERNGKCLHTLNKMNGLCVIDGRDFLHPVLAKIILFIMRLKQK